MTYNQKYSTLNLAMQLISQPSVTPDDCQCMPLLIAELQPLGFIPTYINSKDVKNLWLIKHGKNHNDIRKKCLAFAGHTDVVPTGPLNEWISPPFTPTIRDEKMFGRGASDMKTSIAAFVVACKNFIEQNTDHANDIALIITSDEEGLSIDGTVRVVEWLQLNNIKLDYCIVGEPTAVNTMGDMIKNGRRGSLSGILRVNGIQGHIAYPHIAKNPIHISAPAIVELTNTIWDEGNQFFQPTSFQISNIHAGTGANNVIAGHIEITFNFRFSTENTPEQLKQKLEQILVKHGLDFNIKWILGAEPFLTQPSELSRAMQDAIMEECGITAELSTTGGTSDARFIAKICPQVIECGPPNDSIHQINEHIELKYIDPLMHVYFKVLQKLVL